ncbi:MAG: hypothetical protein LEGION0398_MBIBDBAK_00803 [Legionellaceae bacterium]
MIDEQKKYFLEQMGIELWQYRKAVDTIDKPKLPLIETPLLDSNDAWNKLENDVKACTRCELYKTRKNSVLGSGNQQAKLMIIGEAPGASEDQQGLPFVGRAGQLLTAMLQAIGIKREDIYITNILKSRPPNNRDPRVDEVTACTPFLLQQLELVSPKLILALGRISAHFLLKTDTSLGNLRGRFFEYEYKKTPLLATYHPAYLLRRPQDKRNAYSDLLLVAKKLAEI